ncbi:hypothetical protein JD969_10575 [Planctomycetota bacterium]|nr:hypothetical protein JD969_10575 [Planctomycetota bacterium]
MPKNEKSEAESPQWHITSAIAGWLLPGLGHILLGEKKRGLILMVTISGLWLSGFLIGGIGTFDQKSHPAWFMGQSLNGATIAAWKVQESLKSSGSGAIDPGPQNKYQPPYGHVEAQAVLYTALAGLLNLLAMIDVVYRDPKTHRKELVAKDGEGNDVESGNGEVAGGEA